MRRGMDGRGGLDRLAEKIRKLRAQARRRGDLGGTLDQVRAALDQALATEREALADRETDDARLAELELETLPDDVAGAVRGLDRYSWQSEVARAIFEAIKSMLQREVLDAQFAGIKQALESPDPEVMQRVKDMLADLNALLAAHARQEDTTDQFADFMERHGEFFPEQPETIEELIDALARREAAGMRLMASLSPEQREQLGQLLSYALADADLASEMAQLADNLRALRPGLDREQAASMRPVVGRSATALRSKRLPTWPIWRRWLTSCRSVTGPRRWTTWTSSCWRSTSVVKPCATCKPYVILNESWRSRVT